jgi:hypothetical protein
MLAKIVIYIVSHTKIIFHVCSSTYERFSFYDTRLVKVTLAIKRFCLVVKIKDKNVQSVFVGGKSGRGDVP